MTPIHSILSELLAKGEFLCFISCRRLSQMGLVILSCQVSNAALSGPRVRELPTTAAPVCLVCSTVFTAKTMPFPAVQHQRDDATRSNPNMSSLWLRMFVCPTPFIACPLFFLVVSRPFLVLPLPFLVLPLPFLCDVHCLSLCCHCIFLSFHLPFSA